ncbi:MAG: hypothetical protein K2N81_00145 [Acetatifactor sp.]|nr:hypothetical protein [Acetatifactor sp.]
MSDKEVKQEKVVTKYDRKVQRRKEEKEREQKRKKVNTIIGAVILVALVVFVVSFPVRTYLATHETYVTINGEDITKVEFDYNYNTVVNDFVSRNGSYLGFFGLDVTQDFSKQMYTDKLSWKDYFEEITVDNMKKTKGLKAEADAAGYEFDTAGTVAEFRSTMKDAAKEAKVSTKNYVKQMYGTYATLDAIAGYVAENARVNAYYQQVSEGMTASDEEIENYYKEHTEDYDSIDYYVESFLAETTSEAPTDEEIEAAMNTAYNLADAAMITLEQTGKEITNDKYSDVEYVLADWLFDDSRKEGDTEVIEDADNYMYYAVKFTRRYLDETSTADLRVIMSQDIDGQAVLDEWNAGEATEESFAELCDQYGAVAEGGLIEDVTKDSVSSDIADWVFADDRLAGDTTAITTEEGYTYVIYYVSQGDPEWKAEISNTLLSNAQTDYMDALSEKVIVEDKKGKLHYLKVQAEEETEEVSDGDADDFGEADAEDSGTESSQAQ